MNEKICYNYIFGEMYKYIYKYLYKIKMVAANDNLI